MHPIRETRGSIVSEDFQAAETSGSLIDTFKRIETSYKIVSVLREIMISPREIGTPIKSNVTSPMKSRKRNGSKYDNGKVKFRCDFSTGTQVKAMLARGWLQVTTEGDTSWHLWWCETCDVRQALDTKLHPYQKIPHFRNHYELTRKNYLCRNLKRYRKLLLKMGKTEEAKLCESMPITFELPSEYRMFIEEYHKLGGTWIVKPAGRSQGRGIFLFRKLKDLVDWRNKEFAQQVDGDGSAETFVVQKYVDDPYLLAGRKFDLRIYVLVTSFQPLKVWLAREGFARLSGELFSLERINDTRVHLTNMAIQLKIESSPNNEGPTRAQVKHGCKWGLLKIREYLTARHGVPVVDTLLQRISGVIMGSLHAVQPVIMQGRNSFELYGYDILIDEALTPWLLEVNASPSLTATDAEDHRLKFDMLDDLLTILDFEGYLTGRETRIGGFDLLWDDGPIWISYPNISNLSTKGTNSLTSTKRLNIFLGARNDRVRQLQQLRCSRLKSWIATRSHSQERSMGNSNGLLHQEAQVRLLMAGYIKRKPCKTKAVGV